MHRNTLFACVIAFGCLNIVNSIILETGAATLGLGLAASIPTLTLPTLTLGAAAANAVTLGAVAGVAGLAAAGLLAAAGAAGSKKRSVDSCMPFANPDLFFTLAASSDKLGCAQKLVCVLEKTPDELLSDSEKLILNLFGRAPAPVKFDELNTPKSSFQYAAFVGANNGDCVATFNLCPFDRDTMMQAFAAASVNQL
ncbi:unnamed protein product [Meganyctiphanes norvegica]|uniref:Uncharacterized protein n=1 Tax=Meganyctiphanes norvegica TaxID=48144 RepID=A0AAV2PRJ6_MEGNR